MTETKSRVTVWNRHYVGRITGLSPDTISSYSRLGRIPPPIGKDSRGMYVWDPQEILDWNENRPRTNNRR